jgi:hypothetical protein
MKTIGFDKDDDKFIQEAVRFCRAIDKYVYTLGIDAQEIETLKGDVNVTAYLHSHSYLFTPLFIQQNISAMRNRLTDLCNQFVGSDKYRHDIGVDLGLENAVINRSLYSEYLGAWFQGAAAPVAAPGYDIY